MQFRDTLPNPVRSFTKANSTLAGGSWLGFLASSRKPEAQCWGSSLARHTGCHEDTPPNFAWKPPAINGKQSFNCGRLHPRRRWALHPCQDPVRWLSIFRTALCFCKIFCAPMRPTTITISWQALQLQCLYLVRAPCFCRIPHLLHRVI